MFTPHLGKNGTALVSFFCTDVTMSWKDSPFVGVARLEKAGILCRCRRCVKRARALTSHNAHALFPVQLLVKHQQFNPAAGGPRRKCVDCRTVAVHGCRVAVAFLKAKGPPQAHAHIGRKSPFVGVSRLETAKNSVDARCMRSHTPACRRAPACVCLPAARTLPDHGDPPRLVLLARIPGRANWHST